MNLETRAIPPPIPEDAKRKGPPPIPESARKKSAGPPPIPEAARKAGTEKARQQREQMELTERDVVEAFEISGFKGLEVMATLEKKDERKGEKDNHNEDNIIADPATGLIGVLDGLGGEGKGDLASKAAERAIVEEYKRHLAELKTLGGADLQQRLVEQQLTKAGNPRARQTITDLVENLLLKDPKMGRRALALIEGVRGANDVVRETGGKTTACVGFIHETPDGERYAVVANVGDSAAFKRRASGEWVPLTTEDSALNQLVQAGSITPDMLTQLKLKPEEKIFGEKMSYKDLKRAMTASLGSSSAFEPSLSIRRLDPGDELIIGTDGLMDKFEDAHTDEVSLPAMADAYNGKGGAERLNRLRQAAKKRITYKTDDDIAIVTARVKAN